MEQGFIGNAKYRCHRLLDDFVLQCGNTDRPLLAAFLVHPDTLYRCGDVPPSAQSFIKIIEVFIKIYGVLLCRHLVHAGGFVLASPQSGIKTIPRPITGDRIPDLPSPDHKRPASQSPGFVLIWPAESIAGYRYYDPLRLPHVHLNGIRIRCLPLIPRLSRLFRHSLLEGLSEQHGTFHSEFGVLPLGRYPPTVFTREHTDIPGSRAAPLCA